MGWYGLGRTMWLVARLPLDQVGRPEKPCGRIPLKLFSKIAAAVVGSKTGRTPEFSG